MSSLARIEELEKKYADSPRRFFAPLANEIRKAGNPVRAIELCRTHLAQQPNHMSGQVVLGQALFDAGQLAESRDAFEAALLLDPENLIALRHLGDMAREFGDFASARKWFSRVLDVDSRNHDVIAALREVDNLIVASSLTSSASPVETVEETGREEADSPYKTEDRFEFPTHTPELEQVAPSEPETVAAPPESFAAPAEDFVPPREEPAEELPEIAEALEAPETSAVPLFGETIAADAPRETATEFAAVPSASEPSHEEEVVTPSPELFGAESIESALTPLPAEEALLPALQPDALLQEITEDHVAEELVASSASDLSEDAAAEIGAPQVPADVAPETSAEEGSWEIPATNESPEEDIDDALAWEMEIMAAQSSDDLADEWTPAADQFALDSAVEEESEPEAPFSAPEPQQEEFAAAAVSFEEVVEDPAPDDGEGEGTPGPAVFITETMAQLYEEQGYLEMAAAVYRQLSEKAPTEETLRDRLADLERRIAGRSETSRERQAPAADGESAKDFFASLVQVPLRPRLARPYVSMTGEGADLSPASMAETSPARQATNALSLASVFRNGSSRPGMGGVASGFSFDNFFASGGQAPPTGAVAEKEPRTRRRRGEDNEEIEQFNSWLEGLKRS